MIVSTSRSVPSAATIERPRTSAMPSVSTSTFGSRERRAGSRWRPGSACSPAGSRASPCAQLGVGDLAAQVQLADPPQTGAPGDPEHRDRDRLAGPVDRRARRAAATPGRRLNSARSGRVIGRSRRGMTHGAVRWKRSRRLDLGLDLRHELDRARAGADHGDALAVEVVVVVPRRPSGTSRPRSRRRPGMSGIEGSCSGPAPATRTRAVSCARSRSCSASAAASSSQLAPSQLAAEADVRSQALVGRRPRAGSPGSRAAARRSSSSRGSARTRTSRRGSARRSDSPGTCSRARCRRPRRPSRGSRSRRGRRA